MKRYWFDYMYFFFFACSQWLSCDCPADSSRSRDHVLFSSHCLTSQLVKLPVWHISTAILRSGSKGLLHLNWHQLGHNNNNNKGTIRPWWNSMLLVGIHLIMLLNCHGIDSPRGPDIRIAFKWRLTNRI